MTKPRLLAFGALLIVSVSTLLLWQHRTIQRLEAENAGLRTSTAELDSLRQENSRLTQTQTDPAKLELLRKAQSEIPRLRAEVSRFRRQLKEEQNKRAAPAMENPPATTPAGEPAAAVETYRASVQGTLAPGQTLVTGGWTTAAGKRALVLIEAAIASDAAQAGQVVLQARFVELPDQVLGKVGLEGLMSEGKETSSKAILTFEQNEALVKALEATSGVNVLSAPKISTLDGRQAQMKVVSLRTIAGETYELGPTVDIVPRISPDGASVDLGIIAQLWLQLPPDP